MTRRKLYGDRWRLLGSLGQGGQSHVFRVEDVNGEWPGQYALKRVCSPRRHERFRREVDAIKTLNHPSVITLIDHSALDDQSAAADGQFLVMPIAKGGDLSKPDRLKLYGSDLHAVLQVAKQVAAGLAVAHAKGIIHRDIKPENILFVDASHDVWITDFGICLIRGGERVTETGEAVGARSFMAPELEGGGVLDVTCSADIYSLGKLIFYMYSGGKIIPRETIQDSQFDAIFQSSEPARRLRILLAQMICPIQDRLKTIEDVVTRLNAIQAWERNALSLPIGPSGFQLIEFLQNDSQVAAKKEREQSAALEKRAQIISTVKESFDVWIKGCLKKTAEALAVAEEVKCVAGELKIHVGPRSTITAPTLTFLAMSCGSYWPMSSLKRFIAFRSGFAVMSRQTRSMVTAVPLKSLTRRVGHDSLLSRFTSRQSFHIQHQRAAF
jgi:serine/threonine protein kinase